MTIKFVDVDEVPEKGPPASEIVDAFLLLGKDQVKLDLSDDDRPQQVIYQGIYNTIKNRGLPVRITQVNREIYLQRLQPEANDE